jgi:RNA polymerase sigma-70 factor, ECF subfamily
LADESDRWRLWLERHGAALLLFARQWSATSADAQDAMQNGFLRFWQTRAKARDELAYLYTCVRSAAMDLGRSERRRQARERYAGRAEESAFEPPLRQADRQAMIEAALDGLPGDQREVVVMKIWGGLTFAQIGQALGVPLETAASRYRYALARLEAELSEEVTRD